MPAVRFVGFAPFCTFSFANFYFDRMESENGCSGSVREEKYGNNNEEKKKQKKNKGTPYKSEFVLDCVRIGYVQLSKLVRVTQYFPF